MTNNCQLVRRARRKWYRRLTDKCNMHDRHSGVGVEVPAVYVEVQEENRAQPAADLNADVSCAEVRVTFGTLNMQVKNLDEGFQDILCKCDICACRKSRRLALKICCRLLAAMGTKLPRPWGEEVSVPNPLMFACC